LTAALIALVMSCCRNVDGARAMMLPLFFGRRSNVGRADYASDVGLGDGCGTSGHATDVCRDVVIRKANSARTSGARRRGMRALTPAIGEMSTGLPIHAGRGWLPQMRATLSCSDANRRRVNKPPFRPRRATTTAETAAPRLHLRRTGRAGDVYISRTAQETLQEL
jgi:hypothetical protein